MIRCSTKSKEFKRLLEQRESHRLANLKLIQEEESRRHKELVVEQKNREIFESLKVDWRSELSPQETIEQEQVIVEEIKVKVPEKLKSNWRKDLSEGMTTSALLSTTLPATGDVEYLPTESEQNTVSAGPFVSATAVFDTSRYDTMIVDVEVYDEVFAVLDADQNFLFTTFDGSGTYSFRIPQGKNQLFYFAGPDDSEVEPLVFNVTGIRFQRRTPLNVFVGLDDPEATNFIRTDPIMQGLSAEERRKKLEEMLNAGDEYLLKQLGMQGSIARPADTGNVQSWEQAAGDDWSPNSPTRIEFEKEIAYLNSITDNSFDKMGHYYAPNGMVYPWPPGSSGKTAGLQPGPKYDTQVADELSKAVAAARAEYLKSGQTVAQRQQSYNNLQAAIKASTDYDNQSNKSLTQAGIAASKLQPAFDEWWNRGRDVRIPNENVAPWDLLRADDKAQMGKFLTPEAKLKLKNNPLYQLTDADFTGGPIPKNLDQLKDFLQGKGGATWSFTRGLETGPTPLGRQVVERPLRKIVPKGAARLAGRAIPFAGAALSAADMVDRYSKGDYVGGTLGGLSAVPGPVGWAALGGQMAYDAVRSGNLPKGGTSRRGQGSMTRKRKKNQN